MKITKDKKRKFWKRAQEISKTLTELNKQYKPSIETYNIKYEKKQ